MQHFTATVLKIIQNIPAGKVSTYGQIASMAGHPKGTRQVSRILHSMSRKHDLPWHRVINSKGKISLPFGGGYEQQKALLESEGFSFDAKDRVDFKKFGWQN